jgi:TFIIF-interacting CTD phosphatase-like protein
VGQPVGGRRSLAVFTPLAGRRRFGYLKQSPGLVGDVTSCSGHSLRNLSGGMGARRVILGFRILADDMEPVNPRHLLILDLDETLIHAKEKGEIHELPPPDISIPTYHIWKRPFLNFFIEKITDWFEVAVWTSSSKSYAEAVIPHIFPDPDQLIFVWSRSKCTLHYDHEDEEYFWRKNLDKVKRPFRRSLEQILVIDDSPKKLDRHYGNLISVLPFEGSACDTELRDILPFLEWIRSVPNVRIIEKRHWHNFR